MYISKPVSNSRKHLMIHSVLYSKFRFKVQPTVQSKAFVIAIPIIPAITTFISKCVRFYTQVLFLKTLHKHCKQIKQNVSVTDWFSF